MALTEYINEIQIPSSDDEFNKDERVVRAKAAAKAPVVPAAPTIDLDEWLMDTGSGHDLISKACVEKIRGWIRASSEDLTLNTANGPRKVEKEIPIRVGCLGKSKALCMVLPSTPAVLSIGRRCVEEGSVVSYAYWWLAKSIVFWTVMLNLDSAILAFHRTRGGS